MEDDITKISDLLSSTVYDQKNWTSSPDWNLDYSRMLIDDIDHFRKQLLNQAYGKLATPQVIVEEEPEEPHIVSVDFEIDTVDIELITAKTRETMYRNAVATRGKSGEEEMSWCRDNCTDLWLTRFIGLQSVFRFASEDDMSRFMEKFGG